MTVAIQPQTPPPPKKKLMGLETLPDLDSGSISKNSPPPRKKYGSDFTWFWPPPPLVMYREQFEPPTQSASFPWQFI